AGADARAVSEASRDSVIDTVPSPPELSNRRWKSATRLVIQSCGEVQRRLRGRHEARPDGCDIGYRHIRHTGAIRLYRKRLITPVVERPGPDMLAYSAGDHKIK